MLLEKEKTKHASPFYGRAGKELDKMIEYIGFSDEDRWSQILSNVAPWKIESPERMKFNAASPSLLPDNTA